MSIKIKRVYDAPSDDDGMRILVDKLWPRGLTKEKADVAHWLKEIAPSTELRRWFGHDSDKWHEFKKRYLDELKDRGQQISVLKDYSKKGVVTLVYGAKDQEHNEAIILKHLLD